MKRKVIIYSLLVLLTPFNAYLQEIKWILLKTLSICKNLRHEILLSTHILIGPCKLLDRNTFSNKDVINYINENFYAVKFNAEGNDVIKFKGYTFKNPNYDPAKANRRNSSHELSQALGKCISNNFIFRQII